MTPTDQAPSLPPSLRPSTSSVSLSLSLPFAVSQLLELRLGAVVDMCVCKEGAAAEERIAGVRAEPVAGSVDPVTRASTVTHASHVQ